MDYVDRVVRWLWETSDACLVVETCTNHASLARHVRMTCVDFTLGAVTAYIGTTDEMRILGRESFSMMARPPVEFRVTLIECVSVFAFCRGQKLQRVVEHFIAA